MPLKLTLSEVVLRTSDLARLATFYERLLEERRVRDLTPTYPPSRRRADAPTRMRFIPLDPQRSFGGDMLAIFECEGAGPGAAPPSAGLHHFQMRLESLPVKNVMNEREPVRRRAVGQYSLRSGTFRCAPAPAKKMT